MNSIWTETTELKMFPSLKEDKKTKVLIIGGGMAGILCAYRLAEKGVDYMLVEANRIGDGMTGNTTAKLTSQHGLIYQDIVKKYGVEKALMYYNANELAIRQFQKLSKKADFDFEEKDSFVYTLDDYAKIEKELKALERMGVRGSFVSITRLPFAIAGAVKFEHQAQFHPLKFMNTIATGLNIYEKTMVHSVVRETDGNAKQYRAFTDGGTIIADKVIIATHFPMINRRGFYF